MSDDDPYGRLEREIDDIFSHANPQARMEQLLRESQAKREQEQQELRERLRVQRENDPRYWRGLYDALLSKIEREKEDSKRRRDTMTGMIIVSGVVAVILLLIERFL